MPGVKNIARKPEWLNKKIDLVKIRRIKQLLANLSLNTICEEAGCPNISECFDEGVASFLILGDTCSRNCGFCGVKKGRPKEVDSGEPPRVALAVRHLGLKHVVITSVTRDDLPDGGAFLFAETVSEIRKTGKDIKCEVLVPDFNGSRASLKTVLDAGPDIFAHNVETVRRLYAKVRKKADYALSLGLLKDAKAINRNIFTKSGIMLGLGEKEEEVLGLFRELRSAGCDFLSIGQYLSPDLNSFPVQEFIHPDKFSFYKKEARKTGFRHVESGPYVRSSYLADRYASAG